MKDFFISYNKTDQSWAEWIAWQLEEAGYQVVIQALALRPDSNFVLEMQRAAEEAKRTIMVLSPSYLNDLYTQPEWTDAFAQDPKGEEGTLLPVRVRECELKDLLAQIDYIDLVGLEEEEAKNALLDGIPGKRAESESSLIFPKREVQPLLKRRTQRPEAEYQPFPVALPRIWNVPHNRNRNFTGREELLTNLRTALASGEYTALTQAISWLGGVGKTELAVEYAYRYANEYDIVWWLRAEEVTTLATDYAALAVHLDLPVEKTTKQPLIIEAVRGWLSQNAGWLIIFDNAHDATEIREYLPQGATGHLIITSRDPNWDDVASSLPVHEFKRAESIAFLLKRTGQTDEAAANELADTLGDLPLALEQAGAYIVASGRSLSEYLDLFRDYQQEMPNELPSTDYPDTVATTLEISFRKVKEESPAEAELLNLCAFLAPDDIPKGLLRNVPQYLPRSLANVVAGAFVSDKAAITLQRYSLIKVISDVLSVHRLVQAVVCDRLVEETQKMWAEVAVWLVNDAFPFKIDEVETWHESSRLLPHALAATEHAERHKVAPEETARLLNQTGMYLRSHIEFDEARRTFERALAIEQVFDKNHPYVATILNNLGGVLQDLGDLVGARNNFEYALTIGEKIFGKDHPSVAAMLNNLGDVLQDLGDLEGAKKNYERVLAIDEEISGESDPQVAIDLNNLGLVLYALGNVEGAKNYFERALAIDEEFYGKDHPNVATVLNNLGLVLQDLRDLEGAKNYFERALKIDEDVYRKNHSEVAIDLNSLGNLLYDLGDLEGAKNYFERALKIDEEVYGKDHPNVAIRLNNLGTALHDLRALEGARTNYERALEIFRASLGENHHQTITVRKNLEYLQQMLNG